MELSKEVNESFRQSAQARQKLPQGCEMSVHVLTSGYWPSYHPMEVRLPHELNLYQVRGDFLLFYPGFFWDFFWGFWGLGLEAGGSGGEAAWSGRNWVCVGADCRKCSRTST